MPKHKKKAKAKTKTKSKSKAKAKKTDGGARKRLEEILLAVIDKLGAGVAKADDKSGRLLVTRHNHPSFEIDTKRGVIVEELRPPPEGATTVAETTGDAA